MAELTDRQIQAARPKEQDGHVSDHWISDGGARGSGRLYLRVQANGRKSFFYRYAGPSGKRGAIPLGEYTQRGGRAGLTLNQARDKASELSRLYLDGIRDRRSSIGRAKEIWTNSSSIFTWRKLKSCRTPRATRYFSRCTLGVSDQPSSYGQRPKT